jgi:hypothetical protein
MNSMFEPLLGILFSAMLLILFVLSLWYKIIPRGNKSRKSTGFVGHSGLRANKRGAGPGM